MTHAENVTLEEQVIQKRALLKLSILLAATVPAALAYYFIGQQQNAAAVVTVAWLLVGFFLLELVAIYLVRKNQPQRAIWLVIAGMMVLGLASTVLVSGFGVILGLTYPILALLLTDGILSSKGITRAIIIAVIVGVTILLIDLFGPETRTPAPAALQTFLPAIIITIIIVYALFIILNFKNYSMRAKLITATAMVAIISVVAVTVIVGITTRDALINQVGGNLNSLAESQAVALGEVMARQINVMETLALNRAISDAVAARNGFYGDQTPEEIAASVLQLSREWQAAEATDRLVLSVMNNSTSQQLLTFQNTFPDHTRILLADANGALVAASQRPEKFDFSNEEWWQSSFSSGLASVYVSQPYVADGRDDLLVDIAVPVSTTDETGSSRISGVLLTSYSLNSLVQILRSAVFGQTGHFDLHFPNFRQIEVRANNEVLLQFISPAEDSLVERLWFNDLPFLNENYNGVSSLVSQDRVNTLANEPKVDSLGWRVVAVQEETEALQPVEQQQRTNILLGVAIVLLASGTAAVIAQLLAQPIVRLTNTAVKVADGDLSARAEASTNDEIGTLAMTFNRMTSQLQESIEGLEQRVAERTRALTASVEVSRSLSTVLDPDLLVVEVAEQVRTAFGYYYVQIYLFDEQQHQLKMVGGTGEAGQVLLARGHALAAGQGLVGRAAATNDAVFIPDVAEAPDWKPNPLLPDTRAEIAVPIAVGQQVLGVLDVQHDVSNGLVAEDVEVLQSVAYQVAIAIQNAQSFNQARKQAEHEATINAINQKIQSATSVDAVLQVAATELGHALREQKMRVQLVNPLHQGNGHGRSRSDYQPT